MKIEQIQELQEAILNQIFFSKWVFEDFHATQSVIPPEIFWKYTQLAKLAYWKQFEDIQMTKISTDIVKIWMSTMMVDIMNTPFHFVSFYDDIKILIKEYIMSKWWEDYQKLIDIQEKFVIIDEKKASNSAQNYIIRNLYDGAIEELYRRSERKKKWLTLWYETGLPLLDKYTEWIQKWTLMRLNAYSNVGKSKFSYQIVNKLIEQNAHVVYFSLEVQAVQMIYSLMANKYKKTMTEIYQMEIDELDMWELFSKKLEIVCDKYELDEIIWYATMRKPDVVIIDFVQNIRWKWDEYERMTDIAIRLQQFAIKNNIAIFDMSQISNEWAKSTNTDVIHSKWSGALVASADVALMMNRSKADESIITIKIAKNKFWWRKCMDYKVDFESWIFKEIGETLNDKWF